MKSDLRNLVSAQEGFFADYADVCDRARRRATPASRRR